MFPEEAFEFVREGLRHTADALHGDTKPGNARSSRNDALCDLDSDLIPEIDERRHVSGRQLCIGLRDFAVDRYGLLARTVLNRWGIRKTEDFGTIVYAMIDRRELRAGDNDTLADFKNVYDFVEAFGELALA